MLKQGSIWPLVPIEIANIGMNVMKEDQPRKEEIEVIAIGKEHPKSEIEDMQLPLERLMPFPLLQPESVKGTEACTFCEYLLHYIQDTMTNPITEVTRLSNFIHTYLYIHRNHKYIKNLRRKSKNFLEKYVQRYLLPLKTNVKNS